MSEYEYPSDEYFIEEYVIKKRSREELAEENGVGLNTIKSHLYRKNILRVDKPKHLISPGYLAYLWYTCKGNGFLMWCASGIFPADLRKYFKYFKLNKTISSELPSRSTTIPDVGVRRKPLVAETERESDNPTP